MHYTITTVQFNVSLQKYDTVYSAGQYVNFHLGIGMKKIPQYTVISRYLRYHNLHSKMQWKVASYIIVEHTKLFSCHCYLKNPFKNEIK